MTRTEACQYAHEVRLRRKSDECESCDLRERVAAVNRISAALHEKPAKPFEQILKAVQPMPA